MILSIVRTVVPANLDLQTNDTAVCVLLVSLVTIVNKVKTFCRFSIKTLSKMQKMSLNVILRFSIVFMNVLCLDMLDLYDFRSKLL